MQIFLGKILSTPPPQLFDPNTLLTYIYKQKIEPITDSVKPIIVFAIFFKFLFIFQMHCIKPMITM